MRRDGKHTLDSVVVEDADNHGRFLPDAVGILGAEVEGGAGAGRDVGVVDDAVEGKVNVVGGERLTVVPLHILAQVERPSKAVVGDFPRFS